MKRFLTVFVFSGFFGLGLCQALKAETEILCQEACLSDNSQIKNPQESPSETLRQRRYDELRRNYYRRQRPGNSVRQTPRYGTIRRAQTSQNVQRYHFGVTRQRKSLGNWRGLIQQWRERLQNNVFQFLR